MRALPLVIVAALAAPAAAEERPSEDALFGAPAAAEPQEGAEGAGRPSEADLFGAPAPAEAATPAPALAPETAAQRPAGPNSRLSEDAIFGGGPARTSEEVAPEDPLKIGGQFYMRAQAAAAQDQPPSAWQLSAPTLVDAYFDARPNDRVRGFVLGRLRYDSTVSDQPSAGGLSVLGRQEPLGVDLDQLWLRFDVARTVFVTAGRQHVKWGPSRFWNPTDFLHQVRRDPLALFDARLGTTLLKLHVPWEKYGWNFYGVGILEDVGGADTLRHVGGAARAELVFGSAELGLDAVVQRGHEPRFGADLSAGVGPFDVYGEAALRKGTGSPLYRFRAAPDFTAGLDGLVESYELKGLVVQATGGLNLDIKYSDEDVLTLGAEYFFNQLGYEETSLYPFLIAKGAFTPFYLGKHYAGVFAVLMAPGSWNNTNFIFSTMANLSDESYLTRLDYTVTVLTHLHFEAYGTAHYGEKGGELRFGLDIPAFEYQGQKVGPIHVPAPTFEAGVGLRVSI